MLTVEITNYKTIKHLKFQVEGYTTLLGTNFIGKSAIVNAIGAAFNNKAGDKFIRRGEKFCEVRIIHEDMDILWHKEKGNSYYIVNNVEYLKIGRDVPDVISKAGYSEEMVGNKSVHFVYSKQFQPLFLIDDTGSEYVTDLMSSIFKVDVVYKAQDICKKELKKDRSLLKLRNKDKLAEEAKLEKYGDFEKLEQAIEDISSKEGDISKIEKDLELIEPCLDKVNARKSLCSALKPVSSIEIEKKSLLELDKELSELSDIEALHKRSRSIQAECRPLKSVKDINVPSISKKIEQDITFVSDASSLETKLSRSREKVEVLKSVEEIQEVSVEDLDFEGLVRIEQLRDTLSERKLIASKLKPVSNLPQTSLPELDKDISMLEALVSLQEKAAGYKKEALLAKKQVEELVSEIKATQEELDQFDTCPVCGADL
jgi:DNA repair ATPase RecN